MTIWWTATIVGIAIAIILFLARAKIRGKAVPDELKPGQPLPHFSLTDEHGNPHLASLARERGIPMVLGVLNATSRIPDGGQVAVDGVNGVVRWQPV